MAVSRHPGVRWTRRRRTTVPKREERRGTMRESDKTKGEEEGFDEREREKQMMRQKERPLRFVIFIEQLSLFFFDILKTIILVTLSVAWHRTGWFLLNFIDLRGCFLENVLTLCGPNIISKNLLPMPWIVNYSFIPKGTIFLYPCNKIIHQRLGPWKDSAHPWSTCNTIWPNFIETSRYNGSLH